MILADENIDSRVVSFLRENGIRVSHVKEERPGARDFEVIEMSKKSERVILTEDKDFGEWVYSHNEDGISVILLRYSPPETERILTILANFILERGNDLFGTFTTVTVRKIRIRSLK